MSVKVKLCACGKPLHYSNERIKAMVEDLIAIQGEFIDVKIAGGKTYRVQRHYIALHGLKAENLPSLGFEEVTDGAD